MVSRGNHRRDWWTCPGKGGTWWWLARCVVGPTNVASNNQQTRWSRKEIRIRVQIHTCFTRSIRYWNIHGATYVVGATSRPLSATPLSISVIYFALLIPPPPPPSLRYARGWIDPNPGNHVSSKIGSTRVDRLATRPTAQHWPSARGVATLTRNPTTSARATDTASSNTGYGSFFRATFAPMGTAWISDWPLIVAAKCERSVLRSRDLSQSCANGD